MQQPWTMHKWPEWKHQFQFILATLDQPLEDEQKVILFRDSLGPDGLAIACKLFPELVNYNAKAKESHSFDLIWWQFHEHCWTRNSRDSDPSKEDRMNLRQICDEAMEKAEYHILHKLIPILSLCELECVSQRVPPLERVVQNFIDLFGVKIEPCCLKNHPIGVNESIFAKYGPRSSSLTLKNLPESDAHELFPFFRQVKHFSMVDMEILKDIQGFPADLIELTLIDCKIENNLLLSWLNTLETTLTRLHQENVESFFFFHPLPTVVYFLEINKFKGLISFTFKCNYATIAVDAPKLEFLILMCNGNDNEHTDILLEVPNLKHLYYENSLDARDFVHQEDRKPTLKCLTLKQWEHFDRLRILNDTTVEELEIINFVNPELKPEIESMPTKVLVEYWHIPEPPAEPNLIFEMLNYDCLLEITNHLTKREWMNFGRLHPNAEMVVATYKYPKVAVSSDNLIDTGMYADDKDHFHRVTQHVTCLCINSGSQRTLKSGSVAVDLFDILPSDLDQLLVRCSIPDDPSSTAYMRRLNPTLKQLDIMEWEDSKKLNEQQWQWLTELKDLNEIFIEMPLPPMIMMTIMVRSWDTLETLKIKFSIGEQGWRAQENALRSLRFLRNLKQLDLIRTGRIFYNGDDINLLVDAIRSVAPTLNKLKMTGFWDWENALREILRSDILQNLSELDLEIEDFGEFFALLPPLTKLRKLRLSRWDEELEASDPKYSRLDLQSWLRPLIESLPNLTELNLPFFKSTFKFETEIRQYLERLDRELYINENEF